MKKKAKIKRLTGLKIYISAQNYPEKLLGHKRSKKRKITPQNILRSTKEKKKNNFIFLLLQPTISNTLIYFKKLKKISIIEREQELQQLIKKSDLLIANDNNQTCRKY